MHHLKSRWSITCFRIYFTLADSVVRYMQLNFIKHLNKMYIEHSVQLIRSTILQRCKSVTIDAMIWRQQTNPPVRTCSSISPFTGNVSTRRTTRPAISDHRNGPTINRRSNRMGGKRPAIRTASCKRRYPPRSTSTDSSRRWSIGSIARPEMTD